MKYFDITPCFHFFLNLNQQNHSLLLFSCQEFISQHSSFNFILKQFVHLQLIYSIVFQKHLIVTRMLQNSHLILLIHLLIHLLLLYFFRIVPLFLLKNRLIFRSIQLRDLLLQFRKHNRTNILKILHAEHFYMSFKHKIKICIKQVQLLD